MSIFFIMINIKKNFFIKFCESNNYKKVAITIQNRVVYENKNTAK